MSPPTDSTDSAISRALRRSVPLKSKCSRKWLAPERAGASSRAPLPTHAPTVTDRDAGSDSVTIRRPDGSRVRRTSSSLTPLRGSRVQTRSTARAAATTTATATATTALCSLRAIAAIRRRRRVAATTIGVVADQRERQLAVLVDVVDAHAELVTERQHVFDAVDPLALPELGDVDEAVSTGEDVDERTELGDVDDASLVDRAHLRARRVEDQLDPTPRLLDCGTVLRSDGDDAHTVGVLHRDVGARLLLDR